VLDKGRVVADGSPRDLTSVMNLPTLESAFAELVEQTNTERLAEEIVSVMQVRHA
jgi:ABC-2 type transport system ATP-binding protein